MVIRIPDSAFAFSRPAPPNPLDRLQQNARSMRGLQEGLAQLAQALSAETGGGAEADKALAKARSALQSGAGSPTLEPVFVEALDKARLLQTEARFQAERNSAVGSLVATLKQNSMLPLPFAERAALGRALVARAVREGVLGLDQQQSWEEAATSSALFEETRGKLAATAEAKR